MRLPNVRWLLPLAVAAAAFGAAAQDFPSRPVTMVMPYAPGGPGDTITRVFAAAMQKTLGQQIVVDNRPVMYKNLPYHPVDDFEPIGRATNGPMLIVARNEFPPKDAREFVAYVKANPSKISLAHAGVGSASHLCGLMMMNVLDVKLNEIPYKSGCAK